MAMAAVEAEIAEVAVVASRGRAVANVLTAEAAVASSAATLVANWAG